MELNGLNEFIKFLSTLKCGEVSRVSDGEIIDLTFTMNPPAKIDQIHKVEKDLGVTIPFSYKQFLLKFDGGKIFNYEDLGGFALVGTEEFYKLNKILSEGDEEWIDHIIIFAKCLGEPNYLGFKLEDSCVEAPIVDCYCEELPSEWKVIANNFDEFLARILDSKGEKFWIKRE